MGKSKCWRLHPRIVANQSPFTFRQWIWLEVGINIVLLHVSYSPWQTKMEVLIFIDKGENRRRLQNARLRKYTNQLFHKYRNFWFVFSVKKHAERLVGVLNINPRVWLSDLSWTSRIIKPQSDTRKPIRWHMWGSSCGWVIIYHIKSPVTKISRQEAFLANQSIPQRPTRTHPRWKPIGWEPLCPFIVVILGLFRRKIFLLWSMLFIT